MQRQVREHEAEAVAQLLDQRLPFAVREPGGVQQRERRPGARLAVGDPRAVVVVVEAELHGVGPIVESETPCSERSPHDREILRLALPALGALAAEPLYVLVDTAIVGHLGTAQLASLAIAATVHVDRVHDLQLPHLRHDGAGGAAARGGAGATRPRGSARRPSGSR